MKRPTEVRVGWRTWTILWFTNEEWKESPHCNDDDGGYTWNATNEIWIRDINEPDDVHAKPIIDSNLKMVLMHEVLHAIADTTEVGNAVRYVKSKDAEEVLVNALAAPLLAVLRDNPKLREYLLDL